MHVGSVVQERGLSGDADRCTGGFTAGRGAVSTCMGACLVSVYGSSLCMGVYGL